GSEAVAGGRTARPVADVHAAVRRALGDGASAALPRVAVDLAALDVGNRVGPARVGSADARAEVRPAGGGARARGQVLALALVARGVGHAAHHVGIGRRHVRAGVGLAGRADWLDGTARRDADGPAAVLPLDLVTRRAGEAA